MSNDDQHPYTPQPVAESADRSDAEPTITAPGVQSYSTAGIEPVDAGHGEIDPDEEDEARPERGRKRSNDRTYIRRVAQKYEELRLASPELLELLSAALNVPNTTIDLTVAVISGSRSGLSGLNDTLALSLPGEPYDLIVSAISLGRPRIKGVWAVLAEMGAVTGPIPASDVKAGGAIAKAAGSLGQENIEEITAVLTLAKK